MVAGFRRAFRLLSERIDAQPHPRDRNVAYYAGLCVTDFLLSSPTIGAEKTEAIADLGISNSRMKDFTDIAMAARRCAFDGDTLVAALRATLRRRHTALPDGGIVALSERFVRDEGAQANWKAFIRRNRPGDFDSLDQVVFELRRFLLAPLEHARDRTAFTATWNPPGPWLAPAG